MAEEIKEEVKEAEPWEPIESKLVFGSIVAGIIAMIVLAAIINKFILAQY